ncbi:MAG: sigma-70 family RNA polymerase sigma factor [Tannerellaceae bacterium]|nr:sigma-70 family RNA polymerase sigma factor [Tannerellaceae bacterium]
MNQEITGYMPAEKTDLSSVIKKYHAQLKGYIAKQIPSREEAEDILQNVFYQLTKMYQKDTPIEQVSGWLYAVTRNQITDSYRKKTPESLGFYSTNEEEEYYFPELYEEDNTPEDHFLKSLIWEELEAALEELPAEQKNIFILTELEGFSFKEISETSGIPVNTLLSRKRYAVLYLREKLKGLYEELIYK